MDEMNGNAPHVEGQQTQQPAQTEPPAVHPQSAPAQAAQFLTIYCTNVIGAMVSGIITTLPAFNPPTVAATICRCLGAYVAGMFSGSLQDVLVARGTCRKAFLEGFDSVKPNAAAMTPPGQPLPHLRA
jgi:hypothetical protein